MYVQGLTYISQLWQVNFCLVWKIFTVDNEYKQDKKLKAMTELRVGSNFYQMGRLYSEMFDFEILYIAFVITLSCIFPEICMKGKSLGYWTAEFTLWEEFLMFDILNVISRHNYCLLLLLLLISFLSINYKL